MFFLPGHTMFWACFLLTTSCQYQFLSPKSTHALCMSTDLMKEEQFLIPDSQMWMNAS